MLAVMELESVQKALIMFACPKSFDLERRLIDLTVTDAMDLHMSTVLPLRRGVTEMIIDQWFMQQEIDGLQTTL